MELNEVTVLSKKNVAKVSIVSRFQGNHHLLWTRKRKRKHIFPILSHTHMLNSPSLCYIYIYIYIYCIWVIWGTWPMVSKVGEK